MTIGSKKTYTYNVITVNHKTNERTKMNATPMTESEACVFKTKFTTHPYRHLELEEVLLDLPRLSSFQWGNIPNDYKGVYEDFDGDHPELKGNKTCLTCYIAGDYGVSSSLSIEGLHFTLGY